MSRTLTRPMFRKGGMAQRTNYMGGGIKTVRPESAGSGMTGIMSGIVGRQPFRLGQMAESRPGATFRPKYVPVQKYVTGSYEGDKELELQDALGVEDLGEFTTQKGVTKFKEDPEYTGGGPITEIEKVKEKPKKTIIQQLEDTPSDKETVKDYIDMFRTALEEEEGSTNREKYLQLARFGANLLAQPGGDLVGAVGKAAAPSIEGLGKTMAESRRAKRQAKLLGTEAYLKSIEPGALRKQINDLMALGYTKESALNKIVEEGRGSATREQNQIDKRENIRDGIAEEGVPPRQAHIIAGKILASKIPDYQYTLLPEDPVVGEYYYTKDGKAGKYVIKDNKPGLDE